MESERTKSIKGIFNLPFGETAQGACIIMLSEAIDALSEKHSELADKYAHTAEDCQTLWAESRARKQSARPSNGAELGAGGDNTLTAMTDASGDVQKKDKTCSPTSLSDSPSSPSSSQFSASSTSTTADLSARVEEVLRKMASEYGWSIRTADDDPNDMMWCSNAAREFARRIEPMVREDERAKVPIEALRVVIMAWHENNLRIARGDVGAAIHPNDIDVVLRAAFEAKITEKTGA